MRSLKLLLIPIVLASVTAAYAQQKSENIAARDDLIAALETENAVLRSRLEAEKRVSSLLLELNLTRKSEAESLRAALKAKEEVVTAKTEVIAIQEKQIAELKKRKSSPLKRVGDILIGVAAAVLLK
jgi:homoserine dehydrogenase